MNFLNQNKQLRYDPQTISVVPQEDMGKLVSLDFCAKTHHLGSTNMVPVFVGLAGPKRTTMTMANRNQFWAPRIAKGNQPIGRVPKLPLRTFPFWTHDSFLPTKRPKTERRAGFCKGWLNENRKSNLGLHKSGESVAPGNTCCP